MSFPLEKVFSTGWKNYWYGTVGHFFRYFQLVYLWQGNSEFYIVTYIISCLSLCLMIYLVISSYGIELSLLYQYPEYNILKRISILSLFDRIESIISLVLILFIYTTCVMGCFYIKQTYFNVFKLENNKKNNTIILLLIIIVLIFGTTIFPNNTIGNVIIINIYHILLTLFFFIIPLILVFFTKKKN